MTTQTLEQQIATMNRVLADATEACLGWDTPEGKIPCESVPHQDCQGTGHVARFPGFRQMCVGDMWADCWDGKLTRHDLGQQHQSDCARHNMPAYPNGACSCGVWPDCIECDGTGWQVRAGGLHDALTGLDKRTAGTVFLGLHDWVLDGIGRADAPMPSATEILAKSLELVIEVAGLVQQEHKDTCSRRQIGNLSDPDCDCGLEVPDV